MPKMWIVSLNSSNRLVSVTEEKCIYCETILKWYYAIIDLNVALYIVNRLDKIDAKSLPLWSVTETNDKLLQ
jgi:hypothetical protein